MVDHEDTAATPKRVTTDEGTVEERPVSEAIEAEQYEASKSAPTTPLFGLRMARFKPGGAV